MMMLQVPYKRQVSIKSKIIHFTPTQNIQAQRYATDQRKNFGEEIAQSIRLAKKKRWEAAEKKRQEQEVELESYLINLINSDKEKKLNLVDLDEEGAKRSAKVYCHFL